MSRNFKTSITSSNFFFCKGDVFCRFFLLKCLLVVVIVFDRNDENFLQLRANNEKADIVFLMYSATFVPCFFFEKR